MATSPKLRRLEASWEPFEKLQPWAEVSPRLDAIFDYAREPLKHAIPSIQLREEGPVLVAVFGVSPSYLVEALFPAGRSEFDFVSLHTIANYRVRTMVHRAAAADGSSVKSDVVTIELVHTFGMPTKLSYAGTDGESWLQLVEKAIPVSLLRTSALLAPTHVGGPVQLAERQKALGLAVRGHRARTRLKRR